MSASAGRAPRAGDTSLPQLRKDPVVGRWVIIATERVRRPGDLRRPARPPHPAPCALCPEHEAETPPELLAYRDPPDGPRDGPGWRVRVVPHKFPALRVDGDLERRGQGLYDLMNGIGAHEVIVESPDHDRGLGRLPVPAVAEVLAACRERIGALALDDRLRSTMLFENHGSETGATLGHAHAELIATPVVPLALGDELHGARAYYDYRERCLFCDILQQEIDERTRLVLLNEGVVAFAPFAARVPFETWILPRRHAAAFERIDDAVLRDVAAVVAAVLAKLDRALDDPPYNLVLHSAPLRVGESPFYHWHFEIVPLLDVSGTSDVGTGFHINRVPPEDAARLLRDTPVA